jgi:high-affinity Fe2+/Pb2+ permease
MIGFSSLFRALSLKLRIVVIGGGIVAILAGYGLWHHKVFNSGWNAAIAAIAAQDRRAIDAARTARAHWRACVDGDGVWNVSTGKCRRR